MSENPPPPGSGRDPAWNGNGQQGHGPNPPQQPNTGWNQQSESGWNQQANTGWGQPEERANNGWGERPPAVPTAPPYPRPKRPQSESASAQASQGQYPQHPQHQQVPARNSNAQYAQGPDAAAPAGKSRSRRGLIAMGVVLIVVVALGIGWGAATLFGNDSDGDTVAAPASSEAKSPGSEASSSQGPSESPDPSESPALSDAPAKALEQLIESDRPSVKADLNGKWVPQLSSKKLGLEAEGKTWKEKDILAEHQELREEFPRVQLVWSGDFASFKEDDFWVTVVGIGYDDPEEALSWCSSHGLGADYCYAKQLNTSGGIDGTTRLQD
ncbi:hypothetical protein [Brevibacterium sp. UCMA 11754]|uniref:hypothetical protein n=1 Tax=Brevibacterium sp. UCMA 11754 TaxID=2749198 RepID=UPI001F288B10|nr:hypothetical protein [Brevibacterium sp. UCMA 11754]